MELVSQRDALGKALVALGREFPSMIVLSPDVSLSTQAAAFQAAYPDRFICTGIAEQNTLGMAAGLTSWGYKPCVPLYAVFAAGKALDQVINCAAYPNLDVKIIGTHGGINVGADGPTHQAIADLGAMRSIPNMVVLTPADAPAVEPALRAALNYNGPVYIRLDAEASPVLAAATSPYRIGKGAIIREGMDITIAAIGSMVAEAMTAAEELENKGISARVIDARSLKPIDQELLRAAGRETGGIVTAEDHNCYGGLYSAVAEVVAPMGNVPLRWVALKDQFAESGDAGALKRKYGLVASEIVQAAVGLLAAKAHCVPRMRSADAKT